MTGADLAKLVRDAKRAARLRREPLNLSDLTANLPELVPLAGDFRKSLLSTRPVMQLLADV
ncbi:hypothetical protein EFD55_32840 [Rhizobium pisi]|uniref:Uncharacterized protein n=3 Tax=Rhizobium TaxID=379 RepID=A0A427M5Q6_9HYPH|nr:hypothetical protein EFD55_32840 [Rhizobium pisi]